MIHIDIDMSMAGYKTYLEYCAFARGEITLAELRKRSIEHDRQCISCQIDTARPPSLPLGLRLRQVGAVPRPTPPSTSKV